MYQVLPDEILKSPRGTLLNYQHGMSMRHIRTERWGLIWPLSWPKDWFEITLHRTHPLMWLDPAGKYWMPDKHKEECDLGSVPPPIRSRYPATEFPPEYYFHDDTYDHGYLWTSPSLDGPWVKEPVSRAKGDSNLCDMIYARQYALNAGRIDVIRRGLIWAVVRAMGWAAYSPEPWDGDKQKEKHAGNTGDARQDVGSDVPGGVRGVATEPDDPADGRHPAGGIGQR